MRVNKLWGRRLYMMEITCSDVCEEETVNKRHRVRRDEIACAVCDVMFIPKWADAKTCSNRCRQAAFKAARRAGQPHP
jgi:predicted nucleic acid-binding Zn ribbon protein